MGMGDSVQGLDEETMPGGVGVLVERLDHTVPGPELGFVLAGLDGAALSDDQTLTVAAAWGRQQARAEAGQLRSLALFAATRSRLDP